MATTEEIVNYIKSGSTEKSYELQDKNGNAVGFIPMSQAKNLSEASLKGYEPIYKTSQGWSSTPEVGVSLDKKTGQIKIQAPQSYLESESFKKIYGDSNFLKTLSRSYKQDSNAKFVDPDDDTKSYTVEELVTEYDKAIKDYAKAKEQQANLRHSVRTRSGNEKLASGLTEMDFVYMTSAGTGENDNDNTLISIPTTKGINLLDKIRALPGYNEKYSQVSRGQLNEVYNIANSSREDIVQFITKLAARSAEIEKISDPTAEEITEYARIQALLGYISENEPVQGFWEETGLFTEAGAKGGLSGLREVGGNLLIFAEGAGNILNYALTPWKWGSDIKDVPGYSTALRQDIESTRQAEQQELEEISYINRNAAGIAMIAKLGAEIGANYFVGKAAGQAIEQGVQWLTNKAALASIENSLATIADVPDIMTAEQAAFAATGIPQAASSLLSIAKTNPVAMLSGVNILLNAMEYAGQARQVVDVVNGAIKAINTVAKISPYINLTAQLIVDVATHDAAVFRDIVENADTKDLGELLWTVGSDAALFAGAAAAYWFVNKFPKTAIARDWNRNLSKAIIGTEATVENTKENLKQVVLSDANYISKIKNVSKRQVGEANELVRRAKTAVLTAKGAEATQESLDTLVALQNVVNEGKANLQKIETLMVDPAASPVLAPAYYAAVGTEQNLAKAIADADMPVPKPPKGASIMRNVVPAEVDKYRAAYYQKEQIENYYLETKHYEDGMEVRLKEATEYVTDFESKWPTVATEAQNTIPTYIAAAAAVRDYQVHMDLFTEEQLADMNKSPLYPRGYMPIRSEREFADRQDSRIQLIVNARKNRLTLETQKNKWGPLEDSYQNPLAILEDEMRLTAQVQASRDKLSVMIDPKISKSEVVVPASDVKRVETVKALKKKAQKDIKDYFKGFKENVTQQGLVIDAAKNFLNHSEHLRQQRATQRAGAVAKAAEVKEYKVTATDRRGYIAGLSAQEVSDLSLKHNGYTFSTILPEQFDTAIKGAENAAVRKEIRTSIAGNSKYIGYSKSIGPSSDIVEGFKQMSAESRDALAKKYNLLPTDQYDNRNTIYFDVPEPEAGMTRLYRGMDMPFDQTYNPVFNMNGGAESWTDEWSTAQAYAGQDGYVYYIDVSDETLITPPEGLEAWGGIESQSGNATEYRITPEARQRLSVQPQLYSRNNLSERLADATDTSPIRLDYSNFQDACQFDPTLPERLDRIALGRNKGYIGSKEVEDAIKSNKKNQAVNTAELLWQEEVDALGTAAGVDKAGKRQLVADINDLVTEYIYSGALKSEPVRKTLDALVANEPDPDTAREYIILSELYDYRKSLAPELRKLIAGAAREQISVYNATLPKNQRIKQEDFVTKFADLVEEVLYSRRNDALHALQDAGSEMINQESINREIKELGEKIAGSKIEDNLVEHINENGETEILEVDPIVADLYKYDATTTPKTWFQAFMSNKAFELTHRVFRWSTTTFNAGSFMNQAWRDCLNSYIATGTLMPMSFTEQQLVDNFGERIAEDYRTNQPKLYEWVVKRAEETGKSIAETAVRREMAVGEALAKGATQSAASQLDTSRNAWDKTTSAAEKVIEKLEYYAGGFREESLRRSNFAKAYYDAKSRNMSNAKALEWATRISRDATTDFLRATYHLQAFTGTVPYLRAGVNGSKSFWRLLSLDPVGVLCRLFGGIIIPVMAATMSVLNDEENKKYYKTLKEYEKENVLIYSVNGELFQIPIPQEVGAWVSPLRHLVESLNDANSHDYWELALNDFFNALPYDNFGAFLDIDGNALGSDSTLMQRVGLEFMAAFATFSPTIGKTVFQLTFGVDPYTGRPIDKSYWAVNENGEYELMDSTTSQFAQWLGDVTGGSPSVLATVITGLLGKTSLDLLDSLTSLAQFALTNGEEGSWTVLPERILEDMAGKLTVAEYDRTKSAWNQEISRLYTKKESLREGYVAYTEKINGATTAEQREKYIMQRADYIQDFMDGVQTLCKNLVEVGGRSIDSYRLAALVNLVNWYEEDNVGTNALDRATSDEEKDRAKEAARRTIESMGITTTPSQSLLGYTYRDNNGNVQVKFYTPMEILNAQSIYYTSQSIFAAEIADIFKANGITTQMKTQVFNSYYATNDKTARNTIATAWDTKLATAIAPYVAKYGVDQVTSQKEVIDFLDDYLLIPNDYLQKYNSRVNASRGYAPQFIKDIFGAD